MSIEIISAGDMRSDPADLHVVAVCSIAGVMGAGQAKAYADRWPGLIECHRAGVKYGAIHAGAGHLVWMKGEPSRQPDDVFGVYMLATKDDWRKPSKLEWVAQGLGRLVETLWVVARPDYYRAVRSVAVPSLGCGNGGLSYRHVRPLIEAAAGRVPEVEWRVYEPGAERRAAS